MKLYAAGTNACNQLRFDTGDGLEQPEDIYEFEVILEGDCIEPPTSTHASTIAWCDGKHRHAGLYARTHDGEISTTYLHGPVENFAGETLTVEEVPADSKGDFGSYTIVKETRPRLTTGLAVRQVWRRARPVSQVAAFHVGFIILYQDGTVETLGDRRFPDCLAREVDDEHPAEEPHIVADLLYLDDPVRVVAAGGYTICALTESGALYVWGMTPPWAASNQQGIAGLSHVPNYMEVDGDKDVKDIAVGESHAIALTADGHVHVIGRNDDGQLGLGKEVQDSVDSWTNVGVHLPPGHQRLSVAAGPRTSFILVNH